jgi:hypothetical protein
MATCELLAYRGKPDVAIVVMADRVKPSAWIGYMHIATSGHGRIKLLLLLRLATWNEEYRRFVFAHAHNYALNSHTRDDSLSLSRLPDDAKSTSVSHLLHQDRVNAPVVRSNKHRLTPGISLHIGDQRQHVSGRDHAGDLLTEPRRHRLRLA